MVKGEQCQKRTRFFIRFVITLACLVVLSYQLYLVFQLYLKYPTTVDIRLDPSPHVHLPGITICSELSSAILVEEMVKVHPKLYKVFVGKTRTEISLMLKRQEMRELLLNVIHSLPINQQHQMTVKSNLFFKDCQVPTPLGRIVNEKLFENGKHHLMLESFTNWRDIHSYNTINCSQISPIIETISTDFKCFTLFHNQTIKITDANYQIPKDVAGYLKYLAWIKLNRDFIFNGLIYIHSPKLSHQYSQTSSIQQLDPDRHQFVSIAFEREVLQLLPAPYETNCYDYRQDGYSCRDDCITKCKTEIYTQMDGWPGDVYALKNVTMRLSKLWLNSWSMVGHLEEGVSAESLSKCSFKCGHRDDCESVQYDVRTVRVKERDEGDSSGSHSYTIGILPPKNVQLINKHVPKYEPIEFLIYIGGLISLYTGITAISLGYNIFSWLTFTNKVQNNWIFNKSSKSAAHNYKDANATELLQVKTFDSQAQAPFLKTKF